MPTSLRLLTHTPAAAPSPDAVIAAVATHDCPAALESADPSRGRFTIVACDPLEVATWQLGSADPFAEMRASLNRTTGVLSDPATAFPPAAHAFPCGWIGYFAYEAGRYIERLPATTRMDVGLPVARFALYDSAAVFDAVTGTWTLVAVDLPPSSPNHDNTRPPAHARLTQWEATLNQAQTVARRQPTRSNPTHNMSRADYIRMVTKAIEYIAAGDIFQVNLARRETYPQTEPALATYLRLRQTNPAAYAAFLAWQEPTGGPAALISSSPELLLQLRGRDVLTRPIKGTRPRSPDPQEDQAQAQALCASPKDRAELAMIVDLERNDLGRVCEYGTVRVLSHTQSPADPYTLEQHPTVFHLVADVVGRLAPQHDAIDLLRACFPGGSITGAPKVRAMQIVDELEPTERSVYTGAVGYFGLDGSMTFNIAIRTLVAARGRLHLYVGGGIVADSRPEDEYRETQAKALGLRRALGLTTEID